MARPASEGCPSRYKKEIQALRRLEAAVELDPNVTLARAKASKTKVRSLIDDLAELITISEDAISVADKNGTSQELQKRRGRNSVGRYNDQKALKQA